MESWMLEIGSTGMMAWVLYYVLAKFIPQQRADLIDFLNRNMSVLDKLEQTQAYNTKAIQELTIAIQNNSKLD